MQYDYSVHGEFIAKVETPGNVESMIGFDGVIMGPTGFAFPQRRTVVR